MSKPYRVEIKDNGDWVYYFNNEEVDIHDYRQRIASWEHEQKQAADRARGEQANGIYITQTFRGDGVRHPQLASAPWDNSPKAHFKSYADLDRKAAALGMVGNRSRD